MRAIDLQASPALRTNEDATAAVPPAKTINAASGDRLFR
jgi:hypothetical protein